MGGYAGSALPTRLDVPNHGQLRGGSWVRHRALDVYRRGVYRRALGAIGATLRLPGYPNIA
jgi:hypothetical protein